MPLKPQDLLVVLELATREPRWTYAELGQSLCLSASEANKAVERSVAAGLLVASEDPEDKPVPATAALLEFLAHGVRYSFFARPGRMVRGMATAHSAPPLDRKIRAGDEPPLVWPDPKGKLRGQSVEPLYPTVPESARQNPRLYELLALVDAVRCGRARERKLAVAGLRTRLSDGRGN